MAAFPFADHNPCRLEQEHVSFSRLILQFCIDAFLFLQDDEENVIAVHCKAGKGRTGLMICAYLLFSGVESAQQAMEMYARRRTYNGKGVTIPSQKRYIHYFEAYLKMKLKPPYLESIATILNDPFKLPELLADSSALPLYLKGICIGPLSAKARNATVKIGDFECPHQFVLLPQGAQSSMRMCSIFYKQELQKEREQASGKTVFYYLIYLDQALQLRGDVRLQFKGAGLSFRIWINTASLTHSSDRSYTGYLFRNSQYRVRVSRLSQETGESSVKREQCHLRNKGRIETEEIEEIEEPFVIAPQEQRCYEERPQEEEDQKQEEMEGIGAKKRNDEKSEDSEVSSNNDYDSANLSEIEESFETSFTKDFQSWGTPSRIIQSETCRNTLNVSSIPDEGFGIGRNSEVMSKASQKDGEDPDQEVPVEEEHFEKAPSEHQGSSQYSESRVESADPFQEEQKVIQLVKCEAAAQEQPITMYEVMLSAFQLDALKAKKKSKMLKRLKVKLTLLKL